MKEIYFAVGAAAFIVIVAVDSMIHGFLSAFDRANFIGISKKAQDGDDISQKLEKLAEDESTVVTGMRIIVTMLNCILGILVIDFIHLLGFKSMWKEIGCIIVLMFLIAIIGVVVPGKAVSYNPDRWVYSIFNPVMAILKIFSPVIWIVTKISDFGILILGKNPDEETDNVTEDEIITIVNEGQEQGIIEDSEAVMITNIIGFGDKQASDIMTHRMNINAIDGHTPLSEAVRFILDGNNSRYPVYDNDINNIVGILHIKDVIKESENTENRDRPLIEIENLMYEPEFIPETRNINDLFKLMQVDKIHMAIVVDEYGQTSGLVTMEDILEEIVGNIQDEHDDEEEMIIRSEDNTYIVDGMSLLEDLEHELLIEFDSEYNTINGFMTDRLGKIPSKENIGFTVEYGGYAFTATEVINRVFESISISSLK